MDKTVGEMATLVAFRSALNAALQLMTEEQRKELLNQVSATLANIRSLSGLPSELFAALPSGLDEQIIKKYEHIELIVSEFKELTDSKQSGKKQVFFICSHCRLFVLDGQQNSPCPSCGESDSFELFLT